MLALIETNVEAIQSLCSEFSVRRLDVFGSAVTDAFDPNRSDIDFLIEYAPQANLGPWMKKHFDLRDRLSVLLGQTVDLVMADSIHNPYLLRAIEQSRRPIYASEIPEIA